MYFYSHLISSLNDRFEAISHKIVLKNKALSVLLGLAYILIVVFSILGICFKVVDHLSTKINHKLVARGKGMRDWVKKVKGLGSTDW